MEFMMHNGRGRIPRMARPYAIPGCNISWPPWPNTLHSHQPSSLLATTTSHLVTQPGRLDARRAGP
jgi:hypothetical protein